jgi:hypothetical protein
MSSSVRVSYTCWGFLFAEEPAHLGSCALQLKSNLCDLSARQTRQQVKGELDTIDLPAMWKVAEIRQRLRTLPMWIRHLWFTLNNTEVLTLVFQAVYDHLC